MLALVAERKKVGFLVTPRIVLMHRLDKRDILFVNDVFWGTIMENDVWSGVFGLEDRYCLSYV